MTYTVLTGLDYHDARGKAHRAEPGAVVDNLPKRSIPWLKDQGHIQEQPAAQEEQDGSPPDQQ